jgi:hypothetical protein
MDPEQLAQENALFPWLESDCMADLEEDDYYDDASFAELLNSTNDF